MGDLLCSVRLLLAISLALLLTGGAVASVGASPSFGLAAAMVQEEDDEDDGDDSDDGGATGTTGATGAGALDAPANRPAHIHEGTCADLDPNPLFPLENVVPFSGEDDEVEHSMTTVEASLDDILAAPHAINVHLSPEQADVYVACGEVTGTAVEGELVVALHQQNGSGLAGIAMLTDDGGRTEVHVYLAPCDPQSDGTASPDVDDTAVTPEADTAPVASTEAVVVDDTTGDDDVEEGDADDGGEDDGKGEED